MWITRKPPASTLGGFHIYMGENPNSWMVCKGKSQCTGKRGPEMRPEAEKPRSREAEKPRRRSREAEEPPGKPRSRETEKPRSGEATKQAEKWRSHRTSREAEKPPDKPRSREATGQAEKPWSREATGEAEKPRSPTNDANQMNERNKDRRPLQQSRKPVSATSVIDLRNQNDRCRNQNDWFSNQKRVQGVSLGVLEGFL